VSERASELARNRVEFCASFDFPAADSIPTPRQ
jgi:hypothetical protein